MKPTTELSIGALALIGELRGSHVHVAVRGAGEPGQRPLCGTVVMTSEEWTSLERAEREVGELREALDMATGPHCSTCGNAVDPDVCHRTALRSTRCSKRRCVLACLSTPAMRTAALAAVKRDVPRSNCASW